MIFDWLNTEKEKQFANDLAAYLVEKIPVSGTLGVKKEKARKIDIFNKLFKKVDQYKREHRLNFYKKSVFGNAFQWALMDAGFSREFAKELTTELLLAAVVPENHDTDEFMLNWLKKVTGRQGQKDAETTAKVGQWIRDGFENLRLGNAEAARNLFEKALKSSPITLMPCICQGCCCTVRTERRGSRLDFPRHRQRQQRCGVPRHVGRRPPRTEEAGGGPGQLPPGHCAGP
ncbi:MAG: hypothetical protein MZV65_12975 [Chromatiales bacterium]|nr:hypothetical protein [Chromatiales bacterium]